MDLGQARREIERLDEELLRVLARRLSLMPEIAALKAASGLPLRQPERERELFGKWAMVCEELGLDRAFVEGLFRIVVAESLRLQKPAWKAKQ